MNDTLIDLPEVKKRTHRKREILVRASDTLELSRRDINPEEDEFRQFTAHEVDVYGKTLDDDCMYFEMQVLDGPKAGERCRLTIWAERGRWWWSAPVQRIRVSYDF